jgi:hypothetical protein
MKNVILFLIFPFLLIGQNNISSHKQINQSNFSYSNSGCQDLDEILIDLVSIFGDTSFLDGLLGCAELIPTLESGIVSAFLPFDIPLDCNTDLTPYGFLDINLSDVCQCSCEPFLNNFENIQNLKIINTVDLLGRANNIDGFYFEIYENGSVIKKYNLNK